jgi:phosphoketolase
MQTNTLAPELLRKMDVYWRTANYLSVGQIYLFDNPELIVACVVDDGEAETGPLATAWHSNKFLDPATDGVVLPILHLNGYKISNPTILACIDEPDQELEVQTRGRAGAEALG